MKWFLNQNSKIHGPYENTELQELIQSNESQMKSSFVWTRGMPEWITADKWSPQYIQKINTQQERQFKSNEFVNETGTKKNINVQDISPNTNLDSGKDHTKYSTKYTTKYKVQYDFVDQVSMTMDDLLNFALKQNDVSKITIYNDQTQQWQEIYALTEIADKLGLSRRKVVRIPILAQFIGITNKGLKLNSRVVTISTGGMGLTDLYDLNIEDQIRGQITSPHFFTPLSIEADVTYTGHDGYVGVKFSQVNDDAKALITDYVNRFSEKE